MFSLIFFIAECQFWNLLNLGKFWAKFSNQYPHENIIKFVQMKYTSILHIKMALKITQAKVFDNFTARQQFSAWVILINGLWRLLVWQMAGEGGGTEFQKEANAFWLELTKPGQNQNKQAGKNCQNLDAIFIYMYNFYQLTGKLLVHWAQIFKSSR